MRDLVRRRFWVKCYRLPAVGLGVGTYINGTRFAQLGSAVMVAAAPRCGDAWVPVGRPAQSGPWSLRPARRCIPAITCAVCRGLPVGTALTLAAILGVELILNTFRTRPVLGAAGLAGHREQSQATGQAQAAAASAPCVQGAGRSPEGSGAAGLT